MTFRIWQLFSVVLGSVLSALGQGIYFEAEDMPLHGDWQFVRSGEGFGGGFLISPPDAGVHPAVGCVTIETENAFRLWVRAKDFPEDRPGIRRLALEVNGMRDEMEFGAHGKAGPRGDGWQWERGAEYSLSSGENIVAFLGVTGWARIDAVAMLPEGVSPPGGAVAAKAIKRVPRLPEGDLARPALPDLSAIPPCTISSDRLRVRVKVAENRIYLRSFVTHEGGWVAGMPESILSFPVVCAPPGTVPGTRAAGFWPSWPQDRKSITPCEVVCRGIRYETVQSADTVELSGRVIAFDDVSCRLVDGTLEIECAGESGSLHARIVLVPAEAFPRIVVRFEPVYEGAYAVGCRLTPPVTRDEISEVVCPFMYQFRRLPLTPRFVPTELTSTPLAALEIGGGETARQTFGLGYDPNSLPNEWPDLNTYEAGFQLVDGRGRPEITAWGCVPGGQGSEGTPGHPIQIETLLVASPVGWYETYQSFAQNMCGLRDYRQNSDVSLTETYLNAVTLLKDPVFSGWSDSGMGLWNIESANAMTHASPLALISAALICGDEDLLRSRAVPTLAFLLSRASCHMGVDPSNPGRFGALKLGVPVSTYGTSVRAGAYEMTRRWTPHLRDVALQESGEVIRTGGKTGLSGDCLAAWRLTGDDRYRKEALEHAREYARSYESAQTRPISPIPFYQVTYIGNWEAQLQAGEALGETGLVEHSADVAKRMVAGLFTWPTVRGGEMTVHPEGRGRGNGYVWWKGPNRHLLGFALPEDPSEIRGPIFADVELPVSRVPAWIPSVVGLGVEQPCTYWRGNGVCAHIIMANWAPNLLRLAAMTRDRTFAVAAHNAMLGRWATYPGYYVTDFTDHTRSPEYPYRGPDVSGIYFHHIAPFLAMVQDYLVTDVEVRSEGAISFPFARQSGYVWFDNRVYGHVPGSVYGTENAWLWLRPGLVKTDTPAVNWLAAHTDNEFLVMLTNTRKTPVSVTVTPDWSVVTRGTGTQVSGRVNNGPEEPLAETGGSARVDMPAQGLVVLRWQDVRSAVPLHRVPHPMPPLARSYAVVETQHPLLGTVRAQWLGFGPEHSFVHVYSDYSGKKRPEIKLVLRQVGRERELTHAGWPLEFIVPVGAMPVDLEFSVSATEGTDAHSVRLALSPTN